MARVPGVNFRGCSSRQTRHPTRSAAGTSCEPSGVDLRPGCGIHERPARRRGQPDAATHAVGAARGDAGAPRDGRRPHALAAEPVHGHRDPEPLRADRDLSATRVPARPLPLSRSTWTTRRPSGSVLSCGFRTAASPRCPRGRYALLDVARLPTRPGRPRRDARPRGHDRLRRRRRPPDEGGAGRPARASPRAAIHLLAAAKAHARLSNRPTVSREDVTDMAPFALPHRLVVDGVDPAAVVRDSVALAAASRDGPDTLGNGQRFFLAARRFEGALERRARPCVLAARRRPLSGLIGPAAPAGQAAVVGGRPGP